MKVEKTLELAVEVATANPHHKWKLAAVFVSKKVLAVGLNTYRQNSLPPGTLPTYNLGEHAECACLRLINNKGITVVGDLYVARVTASKHKIGLALPCKACYKRIVISGQVRRIYYTDPSLPRGYGEIRL